MLQDYIGGRLRNLILASLGILIFSAPESEAATERDRIESAKVCELFGNTTWTKTVEYLYKKEDGEHYSRIVTVFVYNDSLWCYHPEYGTQMIPRAVEHKEHYRLLPVGLRSLKDLDIKGYRLLNE